jgi:hypothetical protein
VTTLAQVRDGLEARLNTIDGLRVYNLIPDDAHYPAATIDLTELEYTTLAVDGPRRAVFIVSLFVQRTVDRKQLELYDLIDNGPGSILAAILADPTLGVTGVTAHVSGGPVALDTDQLGLTNLYGRTLNVIVSIS